MGVTEPGLRSGSRGSNRTGRRCGGNPLRRREDALSTEPGESSYTPLWHEVLVTWKAGVTPSMLVKDDQIESLASKDELTMRHTNVVLNCPIVTPTTSTVSATS